MGLPELVAASIIGTVASTAVSLSNRPKGPSAPKKKLYDESPRTPTILGGSQTGVDASGLYRTTLGSRQ